MQKKALKKTNQSKNQELDDNEPAYPAEQIIKRLNAGGWFHLKEGEALIKVKVAAYIRFTETYILVNRIGVMTGQITRSRMLLKASLGEIKLLDKCQFDDG